MKMHKKPTCYMCGVPATSREHVPPVCLFPEEKDIQTSVFRNNLITVPSCDLHNSKKSQDDEFLMGCLAGIIGNNVIGFFHAHTKVKRAMQRKGKEFIHVLMKDAQGLNLKDDKGHVFSVLVGRPDFNRLKACFEHIAYGLYYHKFGKRFEGTCHMLLDFLTYEDERMEKYKLLCRKRLNIEPKKPKAEGANPEIFRYAFFEPDEIGLIALRMAFYEGAQVFVSFQPKDVQIPFNLAFELIHSGIKTFVQFGDEYIEFS